MTHPGRNHGGCSTLKPRYATEAEARTAAITAGKRAAISLTYYPCRTCHGFHLTKSVGGANPKLR